MLWLALLLVAGLAFGGGGSPPPPDVETRCAELVITPAWLEENKARLLAAVQDFMSDPADLATTALLRAMQSLFPDCEWTPSTTTELVYEGTRLRFDEIMRRLQGATVATSGALQTLLGLPPANLPPFPTEGTTAPPTPTPDPTPKPEPTPPVVCDRTKSDGDATLCLSRQPNGTWRARWSRGESSFELDGASASDATILAFQAAASYPVSYVVETPVTRSGVRLDMNGRMHVLDAVTWGQAVFPRLRSQWAQNERDPMGLVLATLQQTFPAANWFRIDPPLGGLDGAAKRVKKVIDDHTGEPDVVDQVARAIIGVQPDKLRHVFRGHVIEIKPSDQGWYSYRVDGGAWTGAYQQYEQALAAAHGAG